MRPARPTDAVSVYVTLDGAGGTTYRLPGPLALVQTDACGADYVITHVNGFSLCELAATAKAARDSHKDGQGAGAELLTSITRGGVTVRALTVVAVHAALLGGDGAAAEQCDAGAGAEQRAVMRAAARLIWGLAGLVYELMHSQAGHWPGLRDAVRRQALAGAVLTQLHGLNTSLALAVLRAYGQLSPARFADMLQSGLLPAPQRPRPAGGAITPPLPLDEACGVPAAGVAPHQAEEAAAQV